MSDNQQGKDYKNKLWHKSIESMDKDLALMVILAGLSKDPDRLSKMFSVACQIMSERGMTDSKLTDLERKAMETATFTFAALIKNKPNEPVS